MKLFSYGYSVGIYFTITEAELAAMTKMSETHYDSRCKAASAHGGFLYGWKNMLHGNDDRHPDGGFLVHADSDEIDTLQKICENDISLTFDGPGQRELAVGLYLKIHEMHVGANEKWVEVNENYLRAIKAHRAARAKAASGK